MAEMTVAELARVLVAAGWHYGSVAGLVFAPVGVTASVDIDHRTGTATVEVGTRDVDSTWLEMETRDAEEALRVLAALGLVGNIVHHRLAALMQVVLEGRHEFVADPEQLDPDSAVLDGSPVPPTPGTKADQ